MPDIKSTPAKIAMYEVRVKGHLDSRRLCHLDGWTVMHQPDGESLLSGPIPDQAALYGLLNWLRDLGVPLLSVMCLEDEISINHRGRRKQP